MASILQSFSAFGQSDPVTVSRSNKNGGVGGLGASMLGYRVYQDFKGTHRSFKKENIDLYGLGFHLGRDWLYSESFLFGLRSEFMIFDTFNSYNRKGPYSESSLDGQVVSYGLTVRNGWVFDIKTKDLIFRDMYSYIGELFFEVGLGAGSANLGRDYTYSRGNSLEKYKIRVIEKYRSQILTMGFNITNTTGGFLEVRISQVSSLESDVSLKGRVKYLESKEDEIDLNLKDVKSTPMIIFGFIVGKHW